MANYQWIKDQCDKGCSNGWFFNQPTPGIATQCECSKRVDRYMALEAAKVPNKYHDLTLDDFEDLEVKAAILPYLQDFHGLYRGKSNIFLMYGPNGTGKTMLSIELLKAALKCKYKIHYAFYPQVFKTFQQKGYVADEEQGKLMKIFRNVDVLILDEVGKEAASARNIEESANLLEMDILKSRLDKLTVLISNNDISQLCNTYNSSITSLLSSSIPFPVLGPDFRAKGTLTQILTPILTENGKNGKNPVRMLDKKGKEIIPPEPELLKINPEQYNLLYMRWYRAKKKAEK